ncbi:MAG TPA: lytic murein transglycosylase [Oryzihumus sp.]|nr:lytic murein transglycosylase [Oryzihumus sp.]
MRRWWAGGGRLVLWATTVLVLGAGTDREVVLGLPASSPTPRAGAPAAAARDGSAGPGATGGTGLPAGGLPGGSAAPPPTRRAALLAQPASWSAPDGGPALPARLLVAYRRAVATAPPGCHLPVTLLEAVGQVESGSLAGRAIDADGRVRPAVVGPALDGAAFAAVRDTDGGRWDADPIWDRAVGPMQFIPGTWLSAGVDADGDGRADPQDVDDAAASAAAYLCSHGRDLARTADLRDAVLAYNHSVDYLTTVLGWMRTFGEHGVSVLAQPAPLSPSSAAAPVQATGPSSTQQQSSSGTRPSPIPGGSPTGSPTGASEGTPTGSPTGDPGGGTPTGTPTPGPGDPSTCRPTPSGDATDPGDTSAPAPLPTGSQTTTPAATPTTVPDADTASPAVTDPGSVPCPTDTPTDTPTAPGTPAPADGPTGSASPTPADTATSGSAPVEPTGAGT